jgi:hypothetical protein
MQAEQEEIAAQIRSLSMLREDDRKCFDGELQIMKVEINILTSRVDQCESSHESETIGVTAAKSRRRGQQESTGVMEAEFRQENAALRIEVMELRLRRYSSTKY